MMVARTGDVEWTADLDSYPVGPPNVRPSGSGRSAVGFNGGGQVREYEVSERSKWFEGGTYRGSRDYARQEVAVDEEVKVDGSRVRISYGVWEQGGEGKEVTVACGEKIFYKGGEERRGEKRREGRVRRRSVRKFPLRFVRCDSYAMNTSFLATRFSRRSAGGGSG